MSERPRMPQTISLDRPLAISVITTQTEPFSSDSARVDLYVAVPYQHLTFLYAVDKYVADYGIVVQVTDPETGTLLLDKYQTRNVLETPGQRDKRVGREDERADASQMTLKLKQRTAYDLRLTFRDLTSKREIDTTIRLRVRSFDPTQISLSDPMLYRSRRSQRILPLIGSDVSTLDPQEAGFFTEVYSTQPSTSYGVVAVLTDIDEDQQSGAKPTRDRDALWRANRYLLTNADKRQSLFMPFDPQDIWMGSYRLHLFLLPTAGDTMMSSLTGLASKAIAYASTDIGMNAQRGIPLADGDIEEAIRQVELIATGSEWDSLRRADTPKEKRQALTEFWMKRDPDRHTKLNEPMIVFYRRVTYANDQFGHGHPSDGWKTDRGRVYIALGAPTTVEKHPYEATAKPYEIWEYFDLNMRLIFVDQYMFGEYRLTGGMPPPPGTFLWQRESF